MQIQTELRPMFSYSIFPILITLTTIAILFWLIKLTKKKHLPPKIKISNHKDLSKIKNKYLLKLQKLENDVNSNKITTRIAYQSLSTITRNFIYEMTNIKVQNYTLKEIEELNIPILYERIKECYNPEFAEMAKGDINLSIKRTRMVIEKWN